jgi:hypothetical protein
MINRMLGNLFENVDSNLSPNNANSNRNTINKKPSKDGQGRKISFERYDHRM